MILQQNSDIIPQKNLVSEVSFSSNSSNEEETMISERPSQQHTSNKENCGFGPMKKFVSKSHQTSKKKAMTK